MTLLALGAAPARSASAEPCLRPSPAALAAREGSSRDALLTQGRADVAAGRFDDAATRLREVAMKHPDAAVALDATKLYLESLHVLGAKESRLTCFDDMESDVPKLRERYCGHDSPKREDETCVLLDQIQVDVLRLRAQQLVEAADKNGGDSAPGLYARAGAAYFDTFREYCDGPVVASRPLHATSSHCVEIAYNAGRAFRAARLTAKAIVVQRALIAFDERAQVGSPLAAKAFYEVGALYQSMALYELAVDWYERYAALFPRAPEVALALHDAVVLRLGLGQEGEAAKDAAMFAKNWGITRRTESAQLTLAIASHHAEHGAWDKVHSVLAPSIEMFDRGPADLTVSAHLLLARAHAQAHASVRAAAEYAKVRGVWSDPAAAERSIRDGRGNDADGMADRRLARALNGIGESMFAAAEEQRLADVEPLKFPGYAGPADSRSVIAHVQTKVRPWFEKKKAAITRIEAEYVKILELEPVPPPAWVIAAGSATGMMWGNLADDFRRVPIPDAWRKDRVLFHAYKDAIDEMSDGIRSRFAKPAITKCVDLAVKYQYSDARSRACEVWLTTNYKREYHVVDELIPAIRTAAPRVYESPALSYEGELHRAP